MRVYVRRAHGLQDPIEVRRLIGENGWATLVASGGNGLLATHLPCLLDPVHDGSGLDDLVVLAHVARADPIARYLESGDEDILLVFEGPNGYVSPTWYGEMPHVGTWNYSAVHVYGPAEVLEGEEGFRVLELTQRSFESPFENPFDFESVLDYARKIAKATLPFRVRARRVEAKAKLSQDKPEEVQERVVRALERDGPYQNRALAREMRRAQEAPGESLPAGGSTDRP